MDDKSGLFYEEHRKLKQKLASFEDAIGRDKQLEESKKELVEASNELHSLSCMLEIPDNDAEEIRSQQSSEEADHEATQAAWKENIGNAQAPIFDIDSPSGTSEPILQTLEQLEEAVKLARLNSLLFEQKLALKIKAEQITNLQAEIQETGQALRAKHDSISELECKILTTERVVRAAKRQCTQRTAQVASGTLNVDVLITSLQTEDRFIKSLQEELAAARNRYFLLRYSDPPRNNTRSRKVACDKTTSQEMITARSMSSCVPSALESAAALYPIISLPSALPAFVESVQSFKSRYDISPEFVLKFKACTKFQDFVNYCANLKFVQADPAYPPTGNSFPSTKAQIWASRILCDMENKGRKFTAQSLEDFFHNRKQGRELFEELEVEYATAMKKYKNQLNNG
jgi:hypothetical protein